MQPNHAIGKLRLADAFLGLQRFDEACQAYQQSLSLNEDNADAWKGLTKALRELGRDEEVREAEQRAEELEQKKE